MTNAHTNSYRTFCACFLIWVRLYYFCPSNARHHFSACQ